MWNSRASPTRLHSRNTRPSPASAPRRGADVGAATTGAGAAIATAVDDADQVTARTASSKERIVRVTRIPFDGSLPPRRVAEPSQWPEGAPPNRLSGTFV